MNGLDVKTLADLVVARAKTDTTSPDPNNLRSGWRTDALLADVDNLVVISFNSPAAYTEIGRQVLAQVQDLPEMSALVQLAIFRGERLLPITPEREQMLVQTADGLNKDVAALLDGTRKKRCKSLLDYHVGVFVDACGRFDLAARHLRQSAKEASSFGDKAGVAIGTFSALPAI